MKRIALGLALGLTISAALAQPDLVLSPGNLYKLIESGQKVDVNHGDRLKKLDSRLSLLERFLNDGDTQDSFIHNFTVQQKRIAMLEKKVTHIVNILKLQRENKVK